jgi:hypothetical protein
MRRVVWWLDTNVSEEYAASIFRRNNPDTHEFYLCRRWNLKSRIVTIVRFMDYALWPVPI